MALQNVLWIALCAAVALGWVWFQYFYRAGNIPNKYLLATLRFAGLMGILLLLLPLRLEKVTSYIEKHRLLLLLDNSSSVGGEPSRDQMLRAQELLSADPDLRQRMDLTTYVFGQSLKRSDSLDFSSRGTDITSALENLSRAQLDDNASIVLVTDGVENLGRSLAAAGSLSVPVYPVVVGDTTTFRDIRIDRLNLNRYAFLGNQFPVEVLLSYRGDIPAAGELSLLDNGKAAYRETVRLEQGRTTARITALLTAEEVGFHTITAVVRPLENEQNTRNNRTSAAIEVVDESTEITIVSKVSHPDIGALKRTIESNEQRKVRVLKPSEVREGTAETDLWVLYQPDRSFRPVYEMLRESRAPLFTLTGELTDWAFLNEVQQSFRLEGEGPQEELLPELNPGFGYFDTSGWETFAYPPLTGALGDYYILQPNEWILGQRVRGVSLNQPLMALIKGSDRREAVLFGSGLWKWRMAAFAREGDFQNFDGILGKLWLFLDAGQESGRLSLEYEPLYNGRQPAVFRARFFDEALRFDPEADLTLQLSDSTGSQLASYPIPLGKGYYQADISNLSPGTYSFAVSVEGTPFIRSGQFRLLSFDLENQQLSSDYQALSFLAGASGGALFFPSQMPDLKDSLLHSDRFRPMQRSRRNVVSLIDYRWLLAMIAAALGAEWFIRKYYGLL